MQELTAECKLQQRQLQQAQLAQAALEEVFGDWDIPAAGMWVQQAGGSWLQPCEMEEAKPGSPVTLLGKRKRGYEDGRCLGFC